MNWDMLRQIENCMKRRGHANPTLQLIKAGMLQLFISKLAITISFHLLSNCDELANYRLTSSPSNLVTC
jgi:hypothetical protein